MNCDNISEPITEDPSNIEDHLCNDCDEDGFTYCDACFAWYCAEHGDIHVNICHKCKNVFCHTQNVIINQTVCNDCIDLENLEAELESNKKLLAKLKEGSASDCIDVAIKKIEEMLLGIDL